MELYILVAETGPPWLFTQNLHEDSRQPGLSQGLGGELTRLAYSMMDAKAHICQAFQGAHTWQDGGRLKNFCEEAGRIPNNIHQQGCEICKTDWGALHFWFRDSREKLLCLDLSEFDLAQGVEEYYHIEKYY